jgi:glycerol-3-phosphate acyltransferase PlsY
VFRVAGSIPALATLLLDAAKGYLAVMFAARIAAHSPQAMGAAALFAIVGHCFPLFLRFRGGKGVATGLGSFLAIDPAAILICAVLFAFDVVLFGYVSLASIMASVAFPFILLWRGNHPASLLIAGFLSAGLIVWRHRENIQRLRAGTEPHVFRRRRDAAG